MFYFHFTMFIWNNPSKQCFERVWPKFIWFSSVPIPISIASLINPNLGKSRKRNDTIYYKRIKFLENKTITMTIVKFYLLCHKWFVRIEIQGKIPTFVTISTKIFVYSFGRKEVRQSEYYCLNLRARRASSAHTKFA